MLLLDMVTDETAESESLALGFRLRVVSCKRLPCLRQYNTKKDSSYYEYLHVGGPNMVMQTHQQFLIKNNCIF